MTSVAFCRPATLPVRRVQHCPTCGSVQDMAGILQLWYGVTVTCLGCGDTWTDGHMCERPFRRAWRDKSKTAAQKAWDAADGWSEAAESAWITEQIGAEQ